MCWKNLTKFKVFSGKQKGEDDDGMAWLKWGGGEESIKTYYYNVISHLIELKL